MKAIDRSSRLRPRRTCEQQHVGLSNAFLHNSATRAKHTRTHVRPYMSDLRCNVIGQYIMGRSLMDRILTPCPLVIALVPFKCSSRNLTFLHSVSFTKEKMPWCPCPFKNEAHMPDRTYSFRQNVLEILI